MSIRAASHAHGSVRTCSVPLPPKQVRHLSLHFNALTSLPAGLGGACGLVWLSLNANRLTQLPQELCHLTNLQRLSLHINKVGRRLQGLL
jgi:Leucine-rich repeat (LRR) protein